MKAIIQVVNGKGACKAPNTGTSLLVLAEEVFYESFY